MEETNGWSCFFFERVSVKQAGYKKLSFHSVIHTENMIEVYA
jgi:hypothetical protein